MPHCPLRPVCVPADALRIGALTAVLFVVVPLALESGVAPIPLFAKDQTGKLLKSEPVGLLYTPDVLAQLTAGQQSRRTSRRIQEAVRDRTPIVVMWRLPSSPQFGAFPQEYSIGIIDAGGDITGRHLPPLWTAHDAEELRRLDSRSRFEEVAIVAAFPLTAFRSGRLLQISTSPQETEGDGVGRRAQTWATIEWDGVDQR